MIDIIHPWDIEPQADRAKWGVGFLNLRGLPLDSFVYQEPIDTKLLHRIDRLVEWSVGNRNWIVCISESTVYARRLFSYVLATYVFTTSLRAVLVDVDDLILAVDEPDGEVRDIIEFADLLLVAYCDPNNQHLKWKRGSIANIFHRRKYSNRATVVDLFVRDIPDNIDLNVANFLSRDLIEIFGETVYQLFGNKDSKRVVIRPDKDEKEKEKKDGKRAAKKLRLKV